MGIFKLFGSKERAHKPPKAKQPKYIYKPYENSMAYRVEFREGAGYVYPGWGKAFLFKIEGEKILSPEGGIQYVTIGDRVLDAAGEKLICLVRGNEIYFPGKREPDYVIKDSIRVQGTI